LRALRALSRTQLKSHDVLREYVLGFDWSYSLLLEIELITTIKSENYFALID